MFLDIGRGSAGGADVTMSVKLPRNKTGEPVGAAALRFSLSDMIAEALNLGNGDRVSFQFGYGADLGKVCINSKLVSDSMSYKLAGEKGKTRSFAVSASKIGAIFPETDALDCAYEIDSSGTKVVVKIPPEILTDIQFTRTGDRRQAIALEQERKAAS